MSDIFLSYARPTQARAQDIAEALRALGYSVWFDAQLPVHRAYADVIAEQLAAARAVLVLWSADAVKSEWVRSEANRAREARKLVQVALDSAALPMPFDQITCVQLHEADPATGSANWHTMLASLAELIGQGPDRRAEPLPLGAGAASPVAARPVAPGAQPPRGNLPLQRTALLGREKQVGELTALLRETPLLTLTGAGGVGKTRLALEVASQVAAHYPGGAWIVEFGSMRDPAATGYAIAGMFGVAQGAGQTIEQSVVAWLGQRRLLLVLDNCEHLLESIAGLAQAILAHCPNVTLLATSREALMLDGERSWPVPSLGFREGADSPAVALFIARARAVAPEFEVGTDVDAVTEICRRLDGIPLAIELAAARIRAMTPAQIRDRLEERFRLLTGGARRALERHQSLRQTVQWSFDLLTAAEARVITRAAVFAGEFSLAAAEAVCAGDGVDAFDVVDCLDSLVRKSLMIAARSNDEVRYRLLETIRQFGEEQLARDEETARIRQRHARFYADDAARHFKIWRSPRQLVAYRWLDREMDNLRAAFHWAQEQSEVEIAADIASNLGDMARFRMRDETRTWPGEIIAAARQMGYRRLIVLLTWQASYAWGEGRLDEARAIGEEAVALLDDSRFEPFVWIYADLAFVAEVQGNPARAAALIRTGAAHPADRVDHFCHGLLPWAAALAGDPAEAKRLVPETLARVETSGVPCVIGLALYFNAKLFAPTAPEVALTLVERGMALARQSGDHWSVALFLNDYAALKNRSGDPTAALAGFLQALDLWRESSERLNIQHGIGHLVVLLERVQAHAAAAKLSGSLRGDFGVNHQVPDFAGALERARRGLGEEAFAAARREGAALSFEEILAFAYTAIRAAQAATAPKAG